VLRALAYGAMVPWHRRRAIRRLRWLERRLPDADVRFAVPFVFRGRGHFRLRIAQEPREILPLYRMVRAQRPRVVVELGTALGGTLYLWAQAAADDAVLVSVDLPRGPLGGGHPACRLSFYRAFAREAQHLHLLRRDSRDPATVASLADLLGGRPIDFLFIDADRSYEGVVDNVRLYGCLVRPGGFIALHGIVPNPRDPGIEVYRLWRHIRRSGDVMEWVCPDRFGHAPGTGLLRVPAEGVAGLLP
jgi:predicted O-methyltransferase YrrM